MTSDEIGERISAARDALKNGQPATAGEIAAVILTAAPNNLDALEIKALADIERGDDAAAEQNLRRAITLAPSRRWPYADLTRLLIRLGRTAEAESVAKSALVADPTNPDAHAILGSLLARREMLVPAAAHLQRAIALVGRHPDLLLGLGRVLLRQGNLEAARPLLEGATAANSNGLEPWVYLAELEERAGNFDAALQLLDRAEPLAKAVGTDIKLQRAVLLDRMGNAPAAIELLEAEEVLSGAALLQRGRLRDKLGRYDEAWSDWTAGKALLANQRAARYPAADVEAQAETLVRFFDATRVAALPRATPRRDVPQPIFIMGFPRSGTTLVEQILASHSAIRAGGELPFGSELRALTASLDAGNTDPRWPVVLRDLYLAMADSFGLTGAGADYFTDKMPLNEMWLPLLRIAFPEAPMVLVRRHPLDVLTSVMAHDMTHGFDCAYRLQDAARHLALMDRVVVQYRSAGIELTHEVTYESLVADPARENERLMAATGLPLEPAQLRFYERAAVSPTPSYAQVREPAHGRSIGRWRNYARQLQSVRPIVAKAMANGSYSD